jgi:hypothetical protein
MVFVGGLIGSAFRQYPNIHTDFYKRAGCEDVVTGPNWKTPAELPSVSKRRCYRDTVCEPVVVAYGTTGLDSNSLYPVVARNFEIPESLICLDPLTVSEAL